MSQQQECAVNEALRERHLAALSEEASREMYDRALRQCQERPSGLMASDQDMIFDMCQAEDVKIAFQKDLKKRGVMVETRNGRQIFMKENPSAARLCRYAELQRKIRADLRLIPPKTAQGEAQPEEDDFDSF